MTGEGSLDEKLNGSITLWHQDLTMHLFTFKAHDASAFALQIFAKPHHVDQRAEKCNSHAHHWLGSRYQGVFGVRKQTHRNQELIGQSYREGKEFFRPADEPQGSLQDRLYSSCI